MSANLCETLPFGRSLAILAKSYYGALTKRLEHLQIERYYSILIVLEDAQSACSQQYICNQLKMDKVSMVRIIDYLLAKKFVKKVLNPNDRREYLIELSKKAIDLLPAIHEAINEVNQAALNGLNAPQKKILYAQLSLIQSNLENLPTQKIYINYKKSSKKE